jgi:hypothetical protein
VKKVWTPAARAAFARKMKAARLAKRKHGRVTTFRKIKAYRSAHGMARRRKNPTKAEVKAAAAKIAKAAGKLAWRGAKLTGRIGRESAKAAAREVKASICRSRTKNPKHRRKNELRVGHIVDWRTGESYIALTRGKKILGRYNTAKEGQAAYRAARARRRNPKRKSIRRRRANPIFRVVIKAVPKGEYKRKRAKNPTAPLYYDGKNFTSNKAKRRTFSSVQPAEVVARHLLHRFPILRKGYVVTLNSV